MYYVVRVFILCNIGYTLWYPIYYMLHVVLSYVLYVTRGFILRIIDYTWFCPISYMLYMVLSYDIYAIHGFILHILCCKTWFYPGPVVA